MKRLDCVLPVICVGLLLAGCSSHEALPPSGPRQPTNVQDVKFYQKHPKKYERLGAISLPITPQTKLDERGDATAAFEALKAKAAALGANGVLLIAEAPGDIYQVTAGHRGTFYKIPVQREPRTAHAQAIFVLEEE